MKDFIVTTNLEEFGDHKLKEVREILKEWEDNGVPDDFYLDEVHLMYNSNSGFVFLTNSDNQSCMLNDEGELEIWYYCRKCGAEGFEYDIEFDKELKLCRDCSEILAK